MIELLDSQPDASVPDAEFFRLLGYPRGYEPGARARELATWARGWFAEHGCPWIYWREVALELGPDSLRLDSLAFDAAQLRRHLIQSDTTRVMLVAASAGGNCEAHARELWEAEKPDEYFFLESFASAVVEHIVAAANGRLCEFAEREGLVAVPHYSPGYAGWEISDQTKLFEIITRGAKVPFPEKLEVLSSGMLRPKKSQLAVVGLTARTPRAVAASRATPCRNCSFTPCRYRRAPYRHALKSPAVESVSSVP